VQALHNVTTLTRATTVSAFQTLSYISEGCIFIYLGLDTLDPIKWQVRLGFRLPHARLDTLYAPMAAVFSTSAGAPAPWWVAARLPGSAGSSCIAGQS
jgi:hypothetical protein